MMKDNRIETGHPIRDPSNTAEVSEGEIIDTLEALEDAALKLARLSQIALEIGRRTEYLRSSHNVIVKDISEIVKIADTLDTQIIRLEAEETEACL